MGVPKFYRWISERYPKINQVITDAALLPEFDHLYLDMNGIIHGCTHPNHMEVSDVLSEKDMMLGIMHYLDRIITQIVKPQVSVFMAIDGVAPRAKLNQQRSRRFRSAKDLAEATKESNDKHKMPTIGLGDDKDGLGLLSEKHLFDSNCITPGTEFMEKVSNCIKYFIRKKIKEDPLWRKLKIIYSGHEIPGEGEHKIMQHIREMRSQPGYKPNTRHCMYGQDADLIMLGLVSHEPHFTLLREIVDFGGFQRNYNALKAVTKFTKQSDFQLMHLSILREYLAIEFLYGLDLNAPEHDLERIVDDWVFMTFLVGNDFLPHMPTLDIGDGAFELLFNTYKEQRPTWGENQYLTSAGEIVDPARLEAFLVVIGAAETEIFEMKEENDVKYMEKKRRWDKRDGKPQGPSNEELANVEKSKQNSYQAMIQDMMEKHSKEDGAFVEGWELPTDADKKDHKGRYYFEKLEFTPADIDDHLALRQSYIEGLIWCLAYYYKGCVSWGWFYPYHYGPLISDLSNLTNVFNKIKFEIGEPLKPFEQLMGCLPPASASIVPRPYRKLMCSDDSPISEFYPKEFKVDMNGKKNPWEGVNILPFIDINLLKQTLKELCPDKLLTADERRRNSRGKVFCYTYDAAMKERVPSFNRDIGIPDILKCNSRVDLLDEPPIAPTVCFKPILIKGTKIPYPGFPSLNVLPIQSAEIKPIGVNCFGTASKYPNTLLKLQTLPQLPGAEQLAESIIGKSLYINWPMMHEAKVVAVSDEKCIVRMVKKKIKVKQHLARDAQRWAEESELIAEQYLNGCAQPGSGGVDIGTVQIRLKLLPLQGMKKSSANGSKKKVFGTEEADVPLQMVLWQSPAPDPRFEERGPVTLKDRFPAQSAVVLTKGKYRGCLGTVISVVGDKVGVKVDVSPPEPPFGLAIARTVQESYISTKDAAKLLKMNPGVFAKITGSLFFNPGNYDLGLNLKYKQDFCVLGYTRKKDMKSGGGTGEKPETKSAWGRNDSVFVVGNQRSEQPEKNGRKAVWEYTPKAVRLVAAFRQKFPMVVNVLTKNPEEWKYDARALGPGGIKLLPQILEWLNSVETAKMPRTPCSTEAMPITAIAAVQRAADVRVAVQDEQGALKNANVKIPASALYLEGSTAATDVLYHVDGESPELGDRIVNLCANGLPFGARGTVVGIHKESTGCVEVVMDREFIGGSTLQGSCSNFRGKLCVWNHLLKVNASNSKDVVDEVIPSGSGKETVDKFLKSSSDSQNTKVIPKESKDEVKLSAPEEDRDVNNGVRGSSPAKSRGGKKGAWREAVGPNGKGIGFKGVGRGGKSGLQAWRNALKSNEPNGLSKEGKGAKPAKKSVTDSGSSAGLKALLGVKKVDNDPKPANPEAVVNASAGLKNMLGIGSSLPKIEAESTIKEPAGPKSAADALMNLMIQSPGVAPPPPVPMQQPMQPTFNFTYVKEGETLPPNANLVDHQGMYPPQPFPQMPYPVMVPHPMMVPVPNQTMNNGEVPHKAGIPMAHEVSENK